jgi:TubC N-terminal docking domain
MTIGVLEELKAIGVEVIPQGDNLLIRPASKVPPELKQRLREHKAEVLAALTAKATLAGVTQFECRHCDGKGECDCPACNLRRVSGPVPCCMCRWEAQQAWLEATRPEKERTQWIH